MSVKYIKTNEEMLGAFDEWRDEHKGYGVDDRTPVILKSGLEFKLSPDVDYDLLMDRIPDYENDGYTFLRNLVANTLDGLGKRKRADFINKIYDGINITALAGKRAAKLGKNLEIMAGKFEKYIKDNTYVGERAQLINKEFFDLGESRSVKFSPMVSDSVRKGWYANEKSSYDGYEFKSPKIHADLDKKIEDDKIKLNDSYSPNKKFWLLNRPDSDLRDAKNSSYKSEAEQLNEDLKKLYPGSKDVYSLARIKMGRGNLIEALERISKEDFDKISPKQDLPHLKAEQLVELVGKFNPKNKKAWFDAIMERNPAAKLFGQIGNMFGLDKHTVAAMAEKFGPAIKADTESVNGDKSAIERIKAARAVLADFKSAVDKKAALAYKLYDIHQKFQKELTALEYLRYDGKYGEFYKAAANDIKSKFYSPEIGNIVNFNMPKKPYGVFDGKSEKEFYEKFADLAQKMKDLVLTAEKQSFSRAADLDDPRMPEFERPWERAVVGLGERNFNRYVSDSLFGKKTDNPEYYDEKRNRDNIDSLIDWYAGYMNTKLDYKSAESVAYYLGEKAKDLTGQIGQADNSLNELGKRVEEKGAVLDRIESARAESAAAAAEKARRLDAFKNEIAVFDPDKFALSKSAATKNYLEKASKRLKNKSAWGGDPHGVVLLDRKLAEDKDKALLEEKTEKFKSFGFEEKAAAEKAEESIENDRKSKEQIEAEKKAAREAARLAHLKSRSEL
ncbi:MAG: hypothetical protein LBH81_00405 [Rickettsiales bacterium]|jgi:hypothetical protein|nr:hypothetical protein [Rickettsiales bacterium]